jgi:hypothetical protein
MSRLDSDPAVPNTVGPALGIHSAVGWQTVDNPRMESTVRTPTAGCSAWRRPHTQQSAAREWPARLSVSYGRGRFGPNRHGRENHPGSIRGTFPDTMGVFRRFSGVVLFGSASGARFRGQSGANPARCARAACGDSGSLTLDRAGILL